MESQERVRSTRRWILDFGVPSLLFVLGLVWVSPFKIDDSYISLRYASNLAAGHGLVFNPGGPPIEGYSNFLLVLIEALFVRAGMTTLAAVKSFLACCGLGLIAVVVAYGRHRLAGGTSVPLSRWLPMLAAALVATSSPVILWTAGGLETVLFALLVTAGATEHALFLQHRFGGPRLYVVDLVWVLAVLTRPEGLLFWLLTIIHLAVVAFAERDWGPLTRRLPGFVASCLAISGYAWWKLAYFGSVVPATYLAKGKSFSVMTLLGGAARLLTFLSINGNFFLILLLMAGAVVLWRQIPLKAPFSYLVGIAGAYLAYLLSLGFRTTMDDAYRFYVPLVPLVSLLLIEAGSLLQPRLKRFRTAAISAGAVAVTFLLPIRVHDLWHAWKIDMNWGVLPYQIPAGEMGKGIERGHAALGKWLKDTAPPEAKIVIGDAGAAPYFSGLYTIDTWSLTDAALINYRRKLSAAESGTEREEILKEMRAYVLEQDPEYILQDQLGLLDDPAVRRRYRPTGQSFLYLDS
ncbi:MAG TPA: hypothetical protein VLF66_18070, partial [Thermoanaerobaculia bacterium]|nr:hypothetical protein [Thermoanaerobaculia bacterium]